MTVRSRFAVLLFLASTALPSAALAQYGGTPPPPSYPSPYAQPAVNRLELTAIAGYQVNTNVDTGSGELEVGDTPVYGAMIGVLARPGSRGTFTWLYSDPTARLGVIGAQSFQVATHYFQLGGEQSMRRGKAEPFAGATLGAALFMPEDIKFTDGTKYDLESTWRFAFTLGLGLKIHLNPKLLLRLETRLAAPVYFSGGGVYAGSGGAGVTVSGGIPIWQWNFLAGLAFGK
jgi:opacity protein-like surface antigen